MESEITPRINHDKFVKHQTQKQNVDLSSKSSSLVFDYASPDDQEVRDDVTQSVELEGSIRKGESL